MKDDARQHLHDIRQAGRAIEAFVRGRTFGEYVTDDLLRSAVERKFAIIGEALNRLGTAAPDLRSQIHGFRDIIAFRNILVHGYDSIDDRIVWALIEDDLKRLLADVERIAP